MTRTGKSSPAPTRRAPLTKQRAYGSYTTYFAAPPKSTCQSPPRSQILPCPHQASHLLVSPATTKYTFGHSFNEEYEDPYHSGVMRQKPIFDLAREGYESLFHFLPKEEAYIQLRTAQLVEDAEDDNSKLIGVHIRHGDHHPWEFKYHKSYIPLETYISTVTNFDLINNKTQQQGQKNITILLASDDPKVYTDLEHLHPATIRAQTLARLPLPFGIWSGEGGFSNRTVWPLFDLSNSSTAEAHEARKTIETLARSYLLDLAILGETKTEAVVCAVSSVTCRLLGVMMGWDAIVGEKWKNVDGEWGWSGLEW